MKRWHWEVDVFSAAEKCLSCEFMIIARRAEKKWSQLNYVYFSVHAISVLLFILNVTFELWNFNLIHLNTTRYLMHSVPTPSHLIN